MGVRNTSEMFFIKACLHLPSISPSPSPSNFIIMPRVMDRLTGTMGLQPILSVNVNLTVTGTETERGNGTLV